MPRLSLTPGQRKVFRRLIEEDLAMNDDLVGRAIELIRMTTPEVKTVIRTRLQARRAKNTETITVTIDVEADASRARLTAENVDLTDLEDALPPD